MELAFARRTTRWILRALIALVIAPLLCGTASVALADQTQPDPAGTATGDRSSAADAAGILSSCLRLPTRARWIIRS